MNLTIIQLPLLCRTHIVLKFIKRENEQEKYGNYHTSLNGREIVSPLRKKTRLCLYLGVKAPLELAHDTVTVTS